MKDDINDRRDDPFFTTGVIAVMLVAVFLAAALFMWAPWTSHRVAESAAPGTTTGQSSGSPRTPLAPTQAPAPTK